MENKKQLIIIPPMSEALKKLNEVLEGIAVDENVEITLIDDLKELSQFVATTGQCLILVSNAKKCATFLQENRAVLAKSYSKTILFTPKEIPNKTLIKFTKIGLTESILEASPPKTFLYKVKLQLRSIKTLVAQDDSENVVKSLDNSKTQNEEDTDNDKKDKVSSEDNVIDMDSGKKKRNDDSGEVIDYSNPLKGKVKSQEDVIDTNWKSDRKKHADIDNTEEENMTAESELNSIDMYYRGKNKKAEALPEEADDDFGKLKRSSITEEVEEESKKSSFADIIEEGSVKLKRPIQAEEELDLEDKKELTELDLIAASKKNKKSFDDIESDLDITKTRSQTEEASASSAETRDKKSEDLGGHLKGKIKTSISEEEDSEEEIQKQYDNSEIEEKERNKDFELNLLDADSKNKSQENEEALEDNIHEGEVDKIDGNMIGDAGTVDKIRTRMNGSSKEPINKSEDDEELDLFSKRNNLNKENKTKKETESIEHSNDDTLKDKKEKTQDVPEEDFQLKKAQDKLDLLTGDQQDEASPKEKEEANKRQTLALQEKEKKEKDSSLLDENEEEDLQLRSRSGSSNKIKKDGNQTHDGNVDKIDKFYRGGESKKQEQNWDNLTDKKNALDLTTGQKKSGLSMVSADAKDIDETIIDYRKLKKEFDLMASDENLTKLNGATTSSETKLKNDDDEGSFKVIEIDPKSLDFAINIINSIYNKDIKAKKIFSMIADELVDHYSAFPIFYNYKLHDKKFTEVFNSFTEMNEIKISQEQKAWWSEFKKDSILFEHFQSKSMTTWRCPEIIKNEEIWEDVELPSWADQELKNKYVELIFPYFDGLDRMGLAVIIFPNGINPTNANGLLTVLEMARTLFLDTIERYQVVAKKDEEKQHSPRELDESLEKKNILSFFGGLFGKKKKAG